MKKLSRSGPVEFLGSAHQALYEQPALGLLFTHCWWAYRPCTYPDHLMRPRAATAVLVSAYCSSIEEIRPSSAETSAAGAGVVDDSSSARAAGAVESTAMATKTMRFMFPAPSLGA